MSNFLYRSKDASRLRVIARHLSDNNSEKDAVNAHVLNEITMRLETGWYEKQEDEHFFHDDAIVNEKGEKQHD